MHAYFVLNLANKQLQEKLCTELKETPAEYLQFANAFEDELERQKLYAVINQEPKAKEEPVCAAAAAAATAAIQESAGMWGRNLPLTNRKDARRVCNQKKRKHLREKWQF